MPRPRGHDPDAVAEALLRAFCARGFEATSFSDLEAATGLDRAQLSRTYGSKKELLLLAMGRAMDARHQEHLAPLAERGGLREIRALLVAIAAFAGTEEGRLGCLVCNTCSESIAAEDEQVQELIRLHFERIEKTFASALKNAVAAGEVDLDRAGIRRSARLLYGVMVALLVLSKAGESPAKLRDMAHQAVDSIG
ncbi:MAG: TetR/AcrR family transcriptional regulator [Planctomycetota bacterium]